MRIGCYKTLKGLIGQIGGAAIGLGPEIDLGKSMQMSAMRAFAVVLAGIGLGGAEKAVAGDNPIVIELYTSQGCSSCPPADKLMHELAKMDNLLPLALHVDYWDYIGWKDEFAIPWHTERQRGYAAMAGSRTIYTPQMVIGGKDHVIGNRPGEVTAHLQAHASMTSPVDVDVERNGNSLTITASSSEEFARPLFVRVVEYDKAETVAIKRGENAGKTLDYINIVQGWQLAGKWSDGGDWSGTAKAEGDNEFAVIVQVGPHGPILAAARVR